MRSLSIVMAVRDGADWIEAAVRSALGADGLLEVVVIDDGSTDASGEIARGVGGPVRVERHAGSGLSAALNAGVAASRGDVLAFLDADDEWAAPDPDPRRPLLAGCDLAFGRVQCFTAAGALGEPGHLGGVTAALIRREAFERVGSFDERMPRGQDLDWLLRAQDAGLRIARTDALAYRYRLRPGSLSEGAGGTRSAGLLAALGSAVARRREEQLR